MYKFISLWPSDAMWQHRSGSTLDQVMACCLTAPSHYLNQCWLNITGVLWHSLKGRNTGNAHKSYYYDRFENYTLKFKATSHQEVNPLHAKFFKGNKKIYLHFMSFFHIDMAQVVEILPQVWQELTYSTRAYWFYIVNIMGAYVLGTQGARASATMIFTMLNWILQRQYHGCWCPGDARSQGISNHDIYHVERY